MMKTYYHTTLGKLKYHFSLKIFFSILIFSGLNCSKNKAIDKLSSKTNYILSSDLLPKNESYYLANGELGFFVSKFENISYGNQLYNSRVLLNTLTGKFSLTAPFYTPHPSNHEINDQIFQVKENRNEFFLLRTVYILDSAGAFVSSYQQLFLTDKNFSYFKRFNLEDSVYEKITHVKAMPDGRYSVLTYLGNMKNIYCYDASLNIVWFSNADYNHIQTANLNIDLLTTEKYIYVLQGYPNNFFSGNYRVLRFDMKGNMSSVKYEISGKYYAFKLLESATGYYIIGTQFIPKYSDMEFHITSMDENNIKIEDHILNLLDSFPTWDYTTSIFKAFQYGQCSDIVKTSTGNWFSILFSDIKDQNTLALVKLNNEMKIEKIKFIDKGVGGVFNFNQKISLMNDGDRMFLIWSNTPNNYFYTLDMNGDIVKN